MKLLFSILLSFTSFWIVAQTPAERLKNDTLIVVEANKAQGFEHAYLLFIPKGTALNKTTYLLVEPNNTGILSDSIEVHLRHAIETTTKNSIGNNVAKNLRIPLLVPVFPRPASKPLVYTHALDRDVMLAKEPDLKRLDLQLLAMIKNASEKLENLKVPVHENVFLNGFSASGSFVNRFAFMHPEKVKAVACGGLNAELMLPLKKLNNHKLIYPLGTYDLPKITGRPFNADAYKQIPQFIYMGELDDNDAVLFDDAYSAKERKIIYATVGRQMQPDRWKACQEIYRQQQVNAQFTTYKEVGHWTTGDMNLKTTYFFLEQMKKDLAK